MPKTAKLLNVVGRVTLHRCIRLDVQPVPRKTGTVVGRSKGIYPIYECPQTGTERIYGCLRLKIPRDELQLLFPRVPVVTKGEALDQAA